MMGLNWLDFLLGAVFLLSILGAIAKGFVAELISLATVIAAVVVALLGYQRAGGWFEDLTKSHQVALAAGFLVLFLGVILVGAVVSWIARKVIRTAGLEWFDRFLGSLFGVLRGMLIASVILLVMMSFSIKPDAVRQSAMAPYVMTGARTIAWVMPYNLRSQFQSGFDKFREAVGRISTEPSKN